MVRLGGAVQTEFLIEPLLQSEILKECGTFVRIISLVPITAFNELRVSGSTVFFVTSCLMWSCSVVCRLLAKWKF